MRHRPSPKSIAGSDHPLGRVLLVLGLMLASPAAFAQPSAAAKETARSLMDDGDKKLAAGDLRAALKAYQAADDIMHVPTTAIEVARTQLKLGLLVEARDTLQRLLRSPVQPGEPAPFRRARSEAEKLDEQLQKRIPSLKISLEGLAPGITPEVFIDGEALPPTALGLPRKSNPGPHHIVASARGYEGASADLTLTEGDSREVTLKLKPLPEAKPPPLQPPPAATAPPTAPPPATARRAPPPPPAAPPPPQRAARTPALAYAGFGLGALGLAVGGVSGLVALSNASSAKDNCQGTRCTQAAQGDLDNAKTWARVANVSFAVGIAGASIGLVTLIASGDRSTSAKRPRVEPVLGLQQAGLRGQF